MCYNDPSGHAAWWVTAGIGLAFDVAADAVIAKVTGHKFDLASSVATNVTMNALTGGLGGKLAKLGKLTKVVQQGLKHGDEAAKAVAPFAEHVLKRGVPLAHGLGEWVQNTPHMSGAASAFQRYVTGAESGGEFLRNGVHFDGIRSTEGGMHVLMDAKYAGASAESFYSKVGQESWAAASVLDEAYRQIKAAGGLGIEWYVSDKTAQQALTELFESSGIRIDVILTPWMP